jgi:hypothetical protein
MAKRNFVLEEGVLLSDYFTQDVDLANKSNHEWVCFCWNGGKGCTYITASHGKSVVRGQRGKFNSNLRICLRKEEEYHDWKFER